MRLAGALRQFWNARLLSEGRDWLQRALRLAGGQMSASTVNALNTESFLAYRQGDYAGMKTATDEALRQAMHIEFSEGIAEANYCRGIYYEMQRQLAEAREHYLKSLALYRELQQRRGIANTLNGLAHVARLAMLELTDAELDQFTGQLGAVLDHAADVEALDLADVPPTAHPLALQNVFRPDEPADGLDRDEVLAAAPAVEDGRFRVPPILGEEP